MTAEFELQHSVAPPPVDPHLLDEDPITEAWPMPPVRTWADQVQAAEQRRADIAQWICEGMWP